MLAVRAEPTICPICSSQALFRRPCQSPRPGRWCCLGLLASASRSGNHDVRYQWLKSIKHRDMERPLKSAVFPILRVTCAQPSALRAGRTASWEMRVGPYVAEHHRHGFHICYSGVRTHLVVHQRGSFVEPDVADHLKMIKPAIVMAQANSPKSRRQRMSTLFVRHL